MAPAISRNLLDIGGDSVPISYRFVFGQYADVAGRYGGRLEYRYLLLYFRAHNLRALLACVSPRDTYQAPKDSPLVRPQWRGTSCR